MNSVVKKQERKKEKENSTMPPGHCAELGHSILFPGILDKILIYVHGNILIWRSVML